MTVGASADCVSGRGVSGGARGCRDRGGVGVGGAVVDAVGTFRVFEADGDAAVCDAMEM